VSGKTGFFASRIRLNNSGFPGNAFVVAVLLVANWNLYPRIVSASLWAADTWLSNGVLFLCNCLRGLFVVLVSIAHFLSVHYAPVIKLFSPSA
jgi:hypothetical protein